MTQSDENRAAEALSLEANETLQAALGDLRATALEALADVDPADLNAIMAAQADIRAIANLRGAIKNMILAGSPQRHRPVA
jgi:hypothetical protein